MQPPQRTPPRGVIFDSSLDESIDQVLALGLLLGFEGKRTIRVAGVSVGRNNLKTAAFMDLVRRFYGGQQPVGMFEGGPPSTTVPPMLQVALDKQEYRRTVAKLNDTADPAAVIRNGLSAQVDDNASIVLAGPPSSLLAMLAWPDGRDWAARKPKVLAIAAGRFDTPQPDPLLKSDIAGFRKLLAEWPGQIVFAGAELGEALPFPGASLDTAFTWAPNHPIVDAYRAAKPMPYDAPTRAMAAVLHAAQPDEGHFQLSSAGTVTITDDGRTQFTPSPGGKHRYLILDSAKKQAILDVYVEMVSAQPPAPRRFGPPGADAAKPDPAKPKPANPKPNPAAAAAKVLLLGALAGGLATVPFQATGQQQASFEQSVQPVLTQTCQGCHNARLASGGLDVTQLNAASLNTHRETWEKILRRVRAGEMPPPSVPKPAAERLTAFTSYVEGVFAQAPADPGRVTAHRLNRNEYTNTIRDLLGVHFRAEKYFPTDDSGEGFDNIGDVLTVSPVLMDRYLAAAEQIAAWAISSELPEKPIEYAYHYREDRLRRIDRSTVEAEHRVEFAGDYNIRFALQGERAKDAAPVTLSIWMDGKLLKSIQAETKPSGLVYFNPYSEEEMKAIYLPEGDHVFRAAFVNDDFVKTLTDKEAYDRNKNKFIDSIIFEGPFRSATPKESRNKVLICDPATGRACVERIVSTLARRAYRRPVTRGEVEALLRFYDLAQRDGQSVERSLQLSIQAILVSPHFLFHIEKEGGPAAKPISEFELASRLSYFLWSSMPDDELLNLAEAGKLRASLDAQVDRMLADPRSAAFADNFAGQWLETRNLDVVKPDPDKFPDWNRDLRDSMKQETTLFFENVLRENRPVSDFIDANYTFLNERLARHYGIEGVTGPEFRRVDLAPGSPRGGVLSQAGVLTVSSYPTRTSPVIRGKYVLQNILGTPPPPPPPDVPPLDESTIGATMSMREQLEKHRADPICASCHSKMDPLGFGLENYNAIGKWRDKDGNFDVDSTGTLPNGKAFTGPAEMRAILTSQLDQFSRTLTEKMLIYALGRGLKPYDTRTVDSINQQLASNEYRFQTLIHQIVHSLPFQSRRGESE